MTAGAATARTVPARPAVMAPDEALAAYRRAVDGSDAQGRAFDDLARLALAPGTAEDATRHLFAEIVEPLCDAFTRRGAATYARLFPRAVAIARSHPDGRALDRALRLCAARAAGAGPVDMRALRRVIVPSRVTLGADVAVTNVVVQGVREAFPDAEIVLLGPASSAASLHGIPGATHVAVPYARHATLMGRLDAWRGLRDLVSECARDVPEGGLLLLDPDSRLTQLGLLPPLPAAQVRHFPSRSLRPADGDPGSATLGALAARWVAGLFDRPDLARLRPRIAVPETAATWAAGLRAAWGADDARPIVAAHFGVGGCAAKRIGPAFERMVVGRLVRTGHRVLLARGAGEDELALARDLHAALLAQGLSVAALPAGRSIAALSGADVATWEADVDAMLAVIGTADAYLGYDSAGQHVAAALGVPTVSVFVPAAGPRHRARWTPSGRGRVRVVDASAGGDGAVPCERVVAACRGLLAEATAGPRPA